MGNTQRLIALVIILDLLLIMTNGMLNNLTTPENADITIQEMDIYEINQRYNTENEELIASGTEDNNEIEPTSMLGKTTSWDIIKILWEGLNLKKIPMPTGKIEQLILKTGMLFLTILNTIMLIQAYLLIKNKKTD